MMSKARFDKAFTAFIRRSEEKILPQTFFQVLAEIERERTDKVIELRARVVGGKLKFAPSAEVSVQDDVIVIGNQRIIVKVS
jgi:hypothetical protein